MYRCTFITVLNLQLFADGGAAGGTAAAGAEGSGVSAPVAGVQSDVKADPQAADGTPAAGVDKEAPTVDRKAEFDKMIKGDYKDLYDANVSAIVQRRLRGPAAEAAKYRELSPTIELLALHYGLDDLTDIKALNAAVEADHTFIERKAYENNMSPEEYLQKLRNDRKVKHIERMNQDLLKQIENRRKQDAMAQQYGVWKQQEAQAQQLFPSLNLDHEMGNPDFMGLLQSGVDVRSAYQVIHADEIYTGLLQTATEKAKQQVAASVAANGARPTENGAGAQSPATVKLDPSKMTREQRRALNERAARGEKVTF